MNENENENKSLKLDYSLKTAEERVELVNKIINETPHEKLTNRYLEVLSDYIILTNMSKEERKKRKILTDNRMVTINKRETSFQGLAEHFENGEDDIYKIIINDKNVILTPKFKISEKDVEEIPPLKELKEAIDAVEEQRKKSDRKNKFLLNKQLIEMRKDQYVIKNAYKKPIYFVNVTNSPSKIFFNEDVKIFENGEEIRNDGVINLLDPKHISLLLCHYSDLKEESRGKIWTDSYFLIKDFDNLLENVLKKDFPLYYDLVLYKIGNKQNIEIQKLLYEKYQIKHSVEYISSLWRNKIPKLLAEKIQEDYLVWYYTVRERGKWKKCSRCGEVKLVNNRFFSRNKSSKDGFYSICKSCRNKKKGE